MADWRMGNSTHLDRLLPLARQLLILPIGERQRELWLWEHSERVMQLTQLLADLPELAGQAPDHLALATAALFHDAGWALEFHQGRIDRWQLLSRPTNEIQRELGAAMLLEEAANLLPGPNARLAADAIRHCNDRRTTLLEAQILAEAENLDELSVVYVLRQYRQYQAENRALAQLVDTWRRQQEYRYWEVRLNEGFRWETTRALARQRLAAVEAFMQALERDLRGADLQAVARPTSAASMSTPG